MNVFILDECMEASIEALCDKHVVSQCKETGQIICTVFHRHCSNPWLDIPVKASHQNHPWVLWAGNTQSNFEWLLNYFLDLLTEYRCRFEKVHAYQDKVYVWAEDNIDFLELKQGNLEAFPICLGEHSHLEEPGDPVSSYRKYYKEAKAYFAKWERGTSPPEWW